MILLKERINRSTIRKVRSLTSSDSIMALNQQKTLLEKVIAELKKYCNALAYEAEKKSRLELLSKSNVLRQAAVEKQELDECLREKQKLVATTREF